MSAAGGDPRCARPPPPFPGRRREVSLDLRRPRAGAAPLGPGGGASGHRSLAAGGAEERRRERPRGPTRGGRRGRRAPPAAPPPAEGRDRARGAGLASAPGRPPALAGKLNWARRQLRGAPRQGPLAASFCLRRCNSPKCRRIFSTALAPGFKVLLSWSTLRHN